MIDWLIEIIISALVVYRVAELIAIDDIAQPLRARMGVYDLAENSEPRTWLGKLFSCCYCLGVWFAFPCALWFDRSLTLPLTWLAIAGAQSFLQSLAGRNN